MHMTYSLEINTIFPKNIEMKSNMYKKNFSLHTINVIKMITKILLCKNVQYI